MTRSLGGPGPIQYRLEGNLNGVGAPELGGAEIELSASIEFQGPAMGSAAGCFENFLLTAQGRAALPARLGSVVSPTGQLDLIEQTSLAGCSDSCNDSQTSCSAVERPFFVQIERLAFVSRASCKKAGTGFDGAPATRDAPWVSVATGGMTKAAAFSFPNHSGSTVRFISEDLATVMVQPRRAALNPQFLRIPAVTLAPGTAVIRAVQQFESFQAVADLNVAVYQPRGPIVVAPHVVQLIGCPAPAVHPSAQELQSGLNNIWDQALVSFHVLPPDFLVGRRAVAADLNHDCVVGGAQEGTLSAALAAIDRAARNQQAAINVYFVQRSASLGIFSPGIAAVEGLEDQASDPRRLSAQAPTDTALLLAHLVGHLLGLGHCDSAGIRDQCGGEPEVSLMSGLPPAGCVLHKPEWDCANGGLCLTPP